MGGLGVSLPFPALVGRGGSRGLVVTTPLCRDVSPFFVWRSVAEDTLKCPERRMESGPKSRRLIRASRGFCFSWLSLASALDGRELSHCTVNDFLPTVTALLSA